MTTEIIANRSNYNLESLLNDDLKLCYSFDIASAFITEHAIDVLNSFIQRNKNRQRTGRLLISLYQSFNSKSVLQQLSKLSSASKNIQVRVSKNPRFHWKYYQFSLGAGQTVYVGSSNFTKEGLNSLGEIVTRMKFSKADKSKYDIYKETFNKEWEESFAIEDLPLNRYKQTRSSSSKNRLHPDILKLLEKKPKQKAAIEIELRKVTTVAGYLSATTKKLIKQTQTHWDRQHWDYFSCHLKSDYDALKSMGSFLIIEMTNRRYYFIVAERLDECNSINTPDGKYFIAYKKLKQKKESNDIRREFEAMGINYHSRNFVSKTLGVRQEKRIFELLGIKFK